MTDPRPAGFGRRRLAARCRRITEAPSFGMGVFVVILLNAGLMGAETYSGLVGAHRQALQIAEEACLTLFALEILLRLGAHADRPKAFFRDPWNIFDLLIVASAFVPFLRENTTVLRLLRLARVLRTARFLPHLRILLLAVGRSLPGTASFLFIGALVVYVYAMVGWVCFAQSDPQHYGSIGRASLTLFLLTTLDGLTDAVRAGLQISRFSILYYASYALFASFVLVNVLIGVVLNSLDEAREMEEADARARERAANPMDPAEEVRDRIAAARIALDDLEASLSLAKSVPAPPPGQERLPDRQLESAV
ncbi:ion transporter [Streptomyces sp. NBC_00091]|uniref:ion transporter n=1 Tax=Streptomyces sp. NBC_00091 TaxID=2975648 RepID=UPI0022505CBC|nr:ion transporter [Streptomyces sp. NBC_00091]MCX5379687.1 ion transporter [Streptomyces sp. NBC_00091]